MEYELLFFTSVANADRIGEIKKGIQDMIESQGGKMSADFSDIGKRKFAHPIKKQTHGFFSFCRFTLDEAENIPEMARRLALNDKIMRHLIVRASEIGKPLGAQNIITERTETKTPARQPGRERAAETLAEAVEKPTEALKEKPAETKAKIGMEELDEKLNEILEETPE